MNPSDVGKLKFRDRVSVNGREGTVVSVHEPEWMDHRSQGYRKVLQGADIEFDDRLGLSVYIHAEGISMLSAEVEPDAPAKDAGGETPRTADVIRYCTLLDDKEAKNYLIDHAITLEREAAALRGEMARREALLNSEITKLRAISDAMKAQVAVARGLCDKAMQEVRDLIDATPELTAADVEELREGIKAALADGKGEKPCAGG